MSNGEFEPIGRPPAPVRRAALWLWISLFLALIETVASLSPMMDEGRGFLAVMGVVFGLTYGINAALIYFVARRRNWARIWLAIFVISSLAAMAAFWREMDFHDWWSWIPSAFGYALEVAALVLLFTGAGARWYRSQA